MSEAEVTSDVATLTVQLLSAYLANNTVASEDLASLIRSTKDALMGEVASTAEPEAETFTPAVSVRKSLASPEYILSLIDGRPYKTLKRHLMAKGLTPDEYRSRYGLAKTYPMVAPAYAEQRRIVAKLAGLGGRKPASAAAAKAKADTPAADTVTDEAVQTAAVSEPEAKKAETTARQTRGPNRKEKSSVALASDASAQPSEAPAPEQGAVEDAAAAAPSKQGATPAKTPRAKAKAGNAPKRQAKRAKPDAVASSAPTPDAAPAPATSEGDAPSAEDVDQKPKRRVKLGIFSKPSAANTQDPAVVGSGSDVDAPAVPSGSTLDRAESKDDPQTRKSTKRMARPRSSEVDS